MSWIRIVVALCGCASLLGSQVEPDDHRELELGGTGIWRMAIVGDLDGDGIEDLAVFGGRPDDEPPMEVVSGSTLETLLPLDHAEDGHRLTGAVCSAGDVDGDGRPDVAVALTRLNALDRVEIRSGADGRTLRTIKKATTTDGGDRSLADLGDVDGDGRVDLLVASAGHGAGPSGGWHGQQKIGFDEDEWGLVKAHSGADGSMLHMHRGGARYADAVRAVPSLDGDEIADFVVTGESGYLPSQRLLFRRDLVARSGRDGSVIWRCDLGPLGASLNPVFEPIGDLDGDGVADLLLGLHEQSELPDGRIGRWVGRLAVISGADGEVGREIPGLRAMEGFGTAIAALGDIDGDGVPDIAVGAPGVRWGEAPSGVVRLISGESGELLGTLESEQTTSFGAALAASVDDAGTTRLFVGEYVRATRRLSGEATLHAYRWGPPSDVSTPAVEPDAGSDEPAPEDPRR